MPRDLTTVDRPRPPLHVTTSWDDGHVTDLRTAALLDCYGLTGTFYIAPRCEELPERDRLRAAQVAELSTRFEIGGHTLTHRRLPSLDDRTAAFEIEAGKAELEDTIGQPLASFCYPGGQFRDQHVDAVRRAGFTVARTVRRFDGSVPRDLLRVGTTVHAYRHLRDPLAIARVARARPRAAAHQFRDWATLAIAIFDDLATTGGVFHLWGHSWEIDRHGDWDRLERVLAHVAERTGRAQQTGLTDTKVITNGELAQVRAAVAPPVVQVVPYYPPHLGGMENVTRTLAEELARTRPVEVLTSRSGADGAPRTERDGNLVVRRLATIEAAHLPVMPTLAAHLLRAPRGAVVHVHIAQAYTPEMVCLAAALRRRPYIAHFHLDVEPSGPLGPVFVAYKRWVLGPVLRRAARVIALTEEQRSFLATVHHVDERRLAVLPNGVAESFFASPRPAPVDRPLRLLTVGRLSAQKNMDRLLHALALVSAEVEVRIVGEGELHDELEATRRSLGLAHVELVGARRGPDLVAMYRWADAFVLASDREGMPLVLLEAMAAALPVVATDVDGISQTVGSDGLLAEPSPAALAAAIDHLASDPDLHLDLATRSAARGRRHSWATLVAEVDDLYAEVVR